MAGRRASTWTRGIERRPVSSGEPDVRPPALGVLRGCRAALFAKLPEADQAAIAAMLRPRRYGRGQVLFQQDEPGSTLYLIEQGRVRLELTSPDGREIVLASLGPGDCFGELALLDGERHQTDAVAREASQLWLLEREDFVGFLNQRPGVAVQLLSLIVQRLRRSTQLAYDVAFLDVPARLARVLLELANQEAVIVRRPLQTELAAMIGATRESTNKWLGTFERMGLIRSEGNSLLLLRPDDLRRRIL